LEQHLRSAGNAARRWHKRCEPVNDPWRVWQLVDSAFPTGGFAHSWGLESAWQCGEVPDESALERFVRDSLLQASRAALPLVNAAHTASSPFDRLDALCDAFLTNPVANRASRAQGRALIATCARTWPIASLMALDVEVKRGCGHAAPVFGATMRALDIPRPIAQRMFLFMTARGVLNAAVRLGIVGSYRAQQMQAASTADLEAIVEAGADLDEDDLTQSAPIIDLMQAAHDRLYSRLFQS
jgi:urease accessory protein